MIWPISCNTLITDLRRTACSKMYITPLLSIWSSCATCVNFLVTHSLATLNINNHSNNNSESSLSSILWQLIYLDCEQCASLQIHIFKTQVDEIFKILAVASRLTLSILVGRGIAIWSDLNTHVKLWNW